MFALWRRLFGGEDNEWLECDEDRICGDLYLIEKLEFDLVARGVIIDVLDHDVVLTTSGNIEKIPTHQIRQVRQFRPTTIQFAVCGEEEVVKQYGMVISDPSKCLQARSMLISCVEENCELLGSLTGTADVFDPKADVFQPWLKICKCTYFRHSIAEAGVINLYNEDDLVILQIELTNEVQLQCNAARTELSFWGPYVPTTSATTDWMKMLVRFNIDLENNDVGDRAAFLAAIWKLVGLTKLDPIPARREDESDCSSTRSEELITDDLYECFSSEEEEEAIKTYTDDDFKAIPRNRRRRIRRESISYDPSYDRNAATHAFMDVGDHHAMVMRRKDDNDFNLRLYQKDDSQIKTSGSCQADKFTYRGHKIVPKDGMLHSNERHLILLDKTDQTKMYSMDLEREQVVAEYSAGGLPTDMIWTTKKRGGSSGDSTFMAANDQSVHLMDTRVPGRPAQSRKYKTRVDFTCSAATDQGNFVLGNSVGEFRLYDGQSNNAGDLKIARNMLTTMGVMIEGIDVSSCGKWVLGTSKQHIFLIDIRRGEKSAFTHRLDIKPRPIVLELRTEDVAKHQLQDVHFRKAIFSPDSKSIITSTGNIQVTWDLQAVLKGKNKYDVKIFDDYIKGAQHLDKSSVIIAFPQQLGICKL